MTFYLKKRLFAGFFIFCYFVPSFLSLPLLYVTNFLSLVNLAYLGCFFQEITVSMIFLSSCTFSVLTLRQFVSHRAYPSFYSRHFDYVFAGFRHADNKNITQVKKDLRWSYLNHRNYFIRIKP